MNKIGFQANDEEKLLQIDITSDGHLVEIYERPDGTRHEIEIIDVN